MNVISKLFTTSFKAALLSSSLFMVFIAISEGKFYSENFILFLISLVVTFVISFIMILTTVLPFYELSVAKKPKNIFNTYFPYYVLGFFTLSIIIIYYVGYSMDAIIFMIIPFTTAMQSWVWFFKTNKK